MIFQIGYNLLKRRNVAFNEYESEGEEEFLKSLKKAPAAERARLNELVDRNMRSLKLKLMIYLGCIQIVFYTLSFFTFLWMTGKLNEPLDSKIYMATIGVFACIFMMNLFFIVYTFMSCNLDSLTAEALDAEQGASRLKAVIPTKQAGTGKPVPI